MEALYMIALLHYMQRNARVHGVGWDVGIILIFSSDLLDYCLHVMLVIVHVLL
jgi:hypothetical protein